MEATALEVDALVRQDDEVVAVVAYSPDPDVRLIRNIWARKGVLERVRGVKFMWGLFACNELLHRRFGRLDSPSCSCCTGTDETPWHGRPTSEPTNPGWAYAPQVRVGGCQLQPAGPNLWVHRLFRTTCAGWKL